MATSLTMRIFAALNLLILIPAVILGMVVAILVAQSKVRSVEMSHSSSGMITFIIFILISSSSANELLIRTFNKNRNFKSINWKKEGSNASALLIIRRHVRNLLFHFGSFEPFSSYSQNTNLSQNGSKFYLRTKIVLLNEWFEIGKPTASTL